MATLDHLHVYAADPEASVAFYMRHFDADRLGALPVENGRENIFLLLGAMVLVVSSFPEGMQAAAPPEPGDGALRSGFGLAHFGLQVDDLDATVERLARGGVSCHGPTREAGPIRYAYLSAPDGVVIELTQYVLPPKLAVLLPAVRLFNGGVHQVRKLLASQLFG